MKDVMDFLFAALPWICIGLLLAIFFAQSTRKKKNNKKAENYSTEGMALGMCFGVAIGIGTRLFERVKTEYPGKTITLNSSPYGLPFYQSLGFHETDAEQTINGIRFTPMTVQIKRNGD